MLVRLVVLEDVDAVGLPIFTLHEAIVETDDLILRIKYLVDVEAQRVGGKLCCEPLNGGKHLCDGELHITFQLNSAVRFAQIAMCHLDHFACDASSSREVLHGSGQFQQ